MTSAIEWCDETVNPFTGCNGTCTWCYARRQARRLSNIPGNIYYDLARQGYDPFTPAYSPVSMGRIREALLSRRHIRRVFVGSMGDICSERFLHIWNGSLVKKVDGIAEYYGPSRVLGQVLALAYVVSRHTYLALTKYPERLSFHSLGMKRENLWMGVSITSRSDVHRLTSLINAVTIDGTDQQWARPWVSLEPFWDDHFNPEDMHGAQWVVIGAQTGPGSTEWVSRGREQAIHRVIDWGRGEGTPVFVKRSVRLVVRGGDALPKDLP